MDCAAPRHDTEPVEAETHSHLCKACRLRLARDLRRLPHLDTELDEFLVTGRTRGHSRGQGDGLPYSDTVSECRSQIRHDLVFWTRHACDTRKAQLPAMTVLSMAGFLRGALAWAIFRDWAGDMAGAIGHDTGRAHALLDPWPTKRFPAHATCPDCGTGQIVCTVYGDNDKRRPYVECDSCEATWLTEQWLRLGQRIVQQRELVA